MNRQVRFSAVPVGEKIEVNGVTYTKTNRGYAFEASRKRISIKKHDTVTWLNAYPTITEK